MSNNEFRMSNVEFYTSSFDIQHWSFDIKYVKLVPLLLRGESTAQAKKKAAMFHHYSNFIVLPLTTIIPHNFMYNNYFQNKTALVTGGGSGIGRAICHELVAAGAIVYCSDIDEAKAEAIVASAKSNNIFAKQLDVRDKSEIQFVLAEILWQHGRIDLVFNNAGTGVIGECRDMDMYDWTYAFDLNFWGVLYGSQYAYLQMLKQGGGQIVNTASLAGLIDGLAVVGPYSTTKHAVAAYTRTLRAEAKALGIKVNLICPGVVNTPITDGSSFIKSSEGYSQYSRDMIAKGISPEKAAHHILKGVAANKAVIVFPYVAKIFLFLARNCAWAARIGINKMLKDYRRKYRQN